MTLWQRFVVGFWRDDSRNNQKSPFRQGTNCEHSLRDRQSGHSGLVVRPKRAPGEPPAKALPWNAAAPHVLAHLAFGTPLPSNWTYVTGGQTSAPTSPYPRSSTQRKRTLGRTEGAAEAIVQGHIGSI